MAEPQRESWDKSKNYNFVEAIAGRVAQDWALNETQSIQSEARRQLGNAILRPNAIRLGLEPTLLGSGQIKFEKGKVWINGDILEVPEATLVYADPGSGVDTIWLRRTILKVTSNEDTSLVAPATGDPVEERRQWQVALANASPDAFLEEFTEFPFPNSLARSGWTIVSGQAAISYPAKIGIASVKFTHTSGVTTQIQRDITLTPSTPYYVYFWTKTVAGQTDLAPGDGAFVDIDRVSPAFAPTDYIFSTSGTWVRHTFAFTSDANADDVQIRVTIPSGAPDSQILIDSVQVTTVPLAAQELSRAYEALYFWDRNTDIVTPKITQASTLRLDDLQGTLDGRNIRHLTENTGLQQSSAQHIYDQNGQFIVQPGLAVTRTPPGDTGTELTVEIGAGKGYVNGFETILADPVEVLLDRALDFEQILNEGKTAFFGTQLYALNKAVGIDNFPIKQVNTLTATVEEIRSITRGGVIDTSDTTGVSNVTAIVSASQGAAAGLTGTNTTTFVFTEATNTFKVQVTDYEGGVGVLQTMLFAPGSYTIAEVLAALSRGSGRAYRSGGIVGNVRFDNVAGAVRIRTKAEDNQSTVTMGDGTSTANAVLGFTNSATNTGTGVFYAQTTDWLISGNSIDWSPAGIEPGIGTSYTAVVRYTRTFAVNTDYLLAGAFASEVDRFYRVTAFGPNGEGLVSNTVNRVTPIGSINLVSWPTVPNAVSYGLYRSDNGGSTYGLLRDVTGISYSDEGSLTPDTGVAPGGLSTTTTGQISGGAGSIPVVATAGFSASGTAYVGGTDEFAYTGVTGTSFTGVTGVGATHESGAVVSEGPDMSSVVIAEGELGVLNLYPQGQEPFPGTTMNATYEYYQPRIDILALTQDGLAEVVKGVPADIPQPPERNGDVLPLAQCFIQANSATVIIQEYTTSRGLKTVDHQLLASRVQFLYEKSITQDRLSRVSGLLAGAKGSFADSMLDEVQQDFTHGLYNARLNQAEQWVSLPATIERPALTVNSGLTTVDIRRNRVYLPSTEVIEHDNQQWSSAVSLNPYVGPFASLTLASDPITMGWATRTNLGNASINNTRLELMLSAQQKRIVQRRLPPWVTSAESLQQSAAQRVAEVLRDYQGEPITIRIYGTSNISAVTDHLRLLDRVNRTEIPLTAVAPGVTGTGAGRIKTDVWGRYAATFTVPASTLAVGQAFSLEAETAPGSGIFANFGAITLGGWIANLFPPQHDIVPILYPSGPFRITNTADPIAESLEGGPQRWMSGFGLYFNKIGVSNRPWFLRLVEMESGLPGRHILHEQAFTPADVAGITGQETKVVLDDYFYIPTGQQVAFILGSRDKNYEVRVAEQGAQGRNPARPITIQNYPQGVFFDSANGITWSPHQAVDLAMKLYRRQFSTSGVLEFNNISGITWSDMWLGADVFVPGQTSVAWEYEINGNGIPIPFRALEKVTFSEVATSVIIRARLSQRDLIQFAASPAIVLSSVGVVGFANGLAGAYVSRQVSFSQQLASAVILVNQEIPSGTTVTWYASNDDGVTWDLATLDGTAGIDLLWSEYRYSVTFTNPAGTGLRLRADMTASTSVIVPRISQPGVSVA